MQTDSLNWEPECFSEHEPLEAVLLCSPSLLDVPNQEIADQVSWSGPVDHKRAFENFEELKRALKEAGVEVMDYSEALSDQEKELSEQLLNRVFVRDLACAFGAHLLPGDPSVSMRLPEYKQAQRLLGMWFPRSFKSPHDWRSLEFGDVMLLNKDAVWINEGMRTSEESLKSLMTLLFQIGFSEVGVIDLPRKPETLHLDMNANVAGSDVVIAKHYVRFLPIKVFTNNQEMRFEMPEAFLKRHGFDVHWLDRYETNPDINFLNLDPETLLVSKKAHQNRLKDHPRLKHKRFIEVDVTELEKCGGGIRCMTLPLKRTLLH